MNLSELDFRSQGTKSLLIVLSGPGGVGKSSLIEKWLTCDTSLGYLKNVTTRAKRPPDPRTGVDDENFFEFLSVAEFKLLVEYGELVQWCNASKGYYSGTRIKPIIAAIEKNQNLVFDYTPQLYLNFKRYFKQRVVSIFIAPPSMEELERRLSNRGTEVGNKLNMKFIMGVQDISYVNEHDYYVVNEDLDETLSVLKSIKIAEQAKLVNQINIRKKFEPLITNSMMFYYDPSHQRLRSMDDE